MPRQELSRSISITPTTRHASMTLVGSARWLHRRTSFPSRFEWGSGYMASGRDVGAAVEFRHVSKRYEGGSSSAAVVDLSLTVPPGELCGLVGPRGCG